MKFLNARPNSHQVPYNKTCRYNQTAKNLQRDQLASHSIEVRALAAQVYTCRVCLHFLPHPGTNSHANSNSDTGTSLYTERKQTSSTTIDTLLEARRETNLGLKPLGSFTCTIWRWCKSCANQRGISTTDPRATCIKTSDKRHPSTINTRLRKSIEPQSQQMAIKNRGVDTANRTSTVNK